jgi:hypothetical protein
MRRWLTEQVCQLLSMRVAQLPPARREWGDAVMAEMTAVPAGERRLRWALGSLWFVVSQGGPVPETTVRSWTRPICAALGILTVIPWLAFSIQGLAERDAPDGSFRSTAVVLAAQVILVAAFLANWRRASGRAARSGLLAALAAYGAAAAFSSLDNVGEPVLAVVAALLFAGPPLFAALPLLAVSYIRSVTTDR